MFSWIKYPTKSGRLPIKKILKMLRRSPKRKPVIAEEDFEFQNAGYLHDATPTLLPTLKFQAPNDLLGALSCESMHNSSECEDYTFTRQLYTIEEVDEEDGNEEHPQIRPLKLPQQRSLKRLGSNFSSMCNLADFDDLTAETLFDMTTANEVDYEAEENQEDDEEHQQKPLGMRISSMSSLMDIDNLSFDFLSDRHLGTILEDDEEDFVIVTDTFKITVYV